MERPNVCIIDSGIGGISILDEIDKLIPGMEYTYCADKEFFPYGALSESELIERVVDIVNELDKNFDFQILVVACNTASTIVLPELRRILNKEVIGVVPAIKPAATGSISKVIGILATEATVNRSYTNDLIESFAKDLEVIKVGSNRLVELAENKLLSKPYDLKVLENILGRIIESQEIDTLVLACTHFPFLRDEISDVLGDKVSLIDSGKAIARRVRYILDKIGLKEPGKSSKTVIHFTATSDLQEYNSLRDHFKASVNIDFFSLNLEKN